MWVACYHIPVVCTCFSFAAQLFNVQGVILFLCDVADPVAFPLFFEQDSHRQLLYLNSYYIRYSSI